MFAEFERIIHAVEERGDLYVVVQINIPKKLTDRERELWSELAKLRGA